MQKAMGHAKPSITLDIYAEGFSSQHDTLVEMMDADLEKHAELRPAVGQVVPIRT